MRLGGKKVVRQRCKKEISSPSYSNLEIKIGDYYQLYFYSMGSEIVEYCDIYEDKGESSRFIHSIYSNHVAEYFHTIEEYRDLQLHRIGIW